MTGNIKENNKNLLRNYHQTLQKPCDRWLQPLSTSGPQHTHCLSYRKIEV